MKKVILTGMLILPIVMWGLVTFSSAQEFEHISLDELKKLIEKGDKSIVIVDTQPKGAYDLGHIKGAINFPWGMDLKSPGKLPKDKTLVLYCDCAHEEDSIDTAKQLKEKFGYTKLKILAGGWSKWMAQGYPTEKGKPKK